MDAGVALGGAMSTPLAGQSTSTAAADSPADTRHVIPSVTLAIEVLSVLFNLFVIGSVIVISKTNSDRLAANHVIAALAVTDILYVLLPASFALPSYWSSRWYGGRFTCVLYQLCSDWMLMTSQCLIFCLLIDRLLALRRVINFHNQTDDLSQTRIVVVSCFGVALGITLLALLGFAPDPFQSPPGICLSWMTAPATPGTHEQMVYTGLTITIAFLSTIICTVVAVKSITYVRAIRILYQCIKTDKINPTSNDDVMSNDSQSAIVQYTTIVIAITAVYYVLRLPYFIWLSLYHSGYTRFVHEMHVYNVLSTSLLALLKPLLYPMCSAIFKESYKTTMLYMLKLHCCCYIGKSAKEFMTHVSNINREASVTALMSHDQNAANESLDMTTDAPPTRRKQYHTATSQRNNHNNIKFTSINAQTVSEETKHNRRFMASKKRKAKRPTDFGPCFTLMDASVLADTCGQTQSSTVVEPEMGESNTDFRGSKLSLLSSDSDWSDYGSDISEGLKQEQKNSRKVFCLEESVI